MAERRTPPFTDRIDASLAFNGHLLSVLVDAPVELATRVTTTWFQVVREHCDRGLVVVFDTCVVGRPDPLLLEVAHHACSARAVEDDTVQDGGWEAADDRRQRQEVPPLSERVIAALAGDQDADRVVAWTAIDAALAEAIDRARDPICTVVDIIVAVERLVGICARAIRIGDAAVISTQPTGGRPSRKAAA